MATTDVFTAARLAAALGNTPRAVRGQLNDVTASATVIAGGQPTDAWTLAALPARLKERLETEARARGYRDALALLTRPPRRFKDELPSRSRIASECLNYAAKLQRALARSLTRADVAKISAEQFEADGLADYLREFGQRISARQFRSIFARVLDRDGGNEDWQAWEIYLPQHIRTTRNPAATAESVNVFTEISDTLAGCGDPSAPNEIETREVWLAAFRCVDRLNGEGMTRERAERQVRAHLFECAPFLAPTRDAMLKTFSRKSAAWLAENRDAAALVDGRKKNTGNHDGYELPDDDRDLLLHRAVWKHGGELELAWRELHHARELSALTLTHYKSTRWRMPEKVRDLLRDEVGLLALLHRSKRDFNMAKGYVTRSYEGIPSLYCLQSDDMTPDLACWIPGPDGRPRVIRPQIIITIDFRSQKIVGLGVLPRAQYTSSDIFRSIEEVLAEYGFPKIFYWERGLWERSKLLKGETDPLSLTEISQGFRGFGIEFQHAIHPRSKTVERVIGFLQRAFRGEPGYCGHERTEPIDTFNQQKRLVEGGHVEPSKFFYSFEEFDRRVRELAEAYNQTERRGRIHAGRNPDQVFSECVDASNPPERFNPAVRYLLSTHRREAVITERGISFRLNSRTFKYPHIPQHPIGARVRLWFNVEEPETATVTDLEHSPTSAVTVELAREVNALEQFTGRDAGTLAHELGKIEKQVAPIKARYQALKSKLPDPRPRLLDFSHSGTRDAVELGQRIEEQRRTLTDGKRHRQRAQRVAAAAGLNLPASAATDARTADDLATISKFLPSTEKDDE